MPETANTTTAIARWEPRAIALLDEYPEDKFNVLVPTVQIRQINPFLVPDIEVVKLSVDERKGEVYHDSQMKQGYYAPTAKGLSRLRQVAGIDELDSRRTDDGSDPDVVEWTVKIEMALPSGQRVRAHGTKRIDLKAMKFASDAHRQRQRQFMLEHAQTKALNRAIRSILSLHGSMPASEIAKPFAVLRWVPDMSNPEVRARMLDRLLPAEQSLYGSQREPKQVGPGAEVIDVRPAPDEDDEPTEGEYQELGNGHRHVETATGIVTDAEDHGDPDWFGTAPKAEAKLSLTDRLIAASRGGSEKPATQQQRAALQDVLRGLSTEDLKAGLEHIWDLKDPSAITGGQSEAILAEAEAIGSQALRREWVALSTEIRTSR